MKNIPAFPLATQDYTTSSTDGMTLRDYFAAHIMQGLVVEGGFEKWPAAAHQAYAAADYMLEAREK